MNPLQSQKFVWVLLIWAVLCTSGLLYAVMECWGKAPAVGVGTDGKEKSGLALIMMFGAIGGFVRWMHFLREIERDPKRSDQWFVTSLLTPLMGAALALIFGVTVRAGLVVQGSGGDGKTSVNWLGLYGVAGLVGLFAPDAVRMLARIFRTITGGDDPSKDDKSDPQRPDRGTEPPSR
ncbi:MAG: hypothetical protein JO251_23725 [Verrucomicrobia bacterium]|nr:hypothetical protein [Verrucomicrobiota bacterium]